MTQYMVNFHQFLFLLGGDIHAVTVGVCSRYKSIGSSFKPSNLLLCSLSYFR